MLVHGCVMVTAAQVHPDFTESSPSQTSCVYCNDAVRTNASVFQVHVSSNLHVTDNLHEL